MAEYTVTTTEAQEAILGWHIARFPELFPTVGAWLQYAQDADIAGLLQEKRALETAERLQAVMDDEPDEEPADEPGDVPPAVLP